MDTSTGKLFDSVLARPRKDSSVKRKQTKVAEETELTQNIGVTCVVSGLRQYITSRRMGYVNTQTQMITIETYPMKWQVKRLDQDFETLRHYLLRSFP